MNWYKTSIELTPDWRSNDKYMPIIKDIENELKNDLLPKLDMFSSFSVVPSMKEDGYQKGTSSNPVIALNIDTCIGESDQNNTAIETIIRLRILHGLGYAIQEALGTGFDSGWVGLFARRWNQGNGLIPMNVR